MMLNKRTLPKLLLAACIGMLWITSHSAALSLDELLEKTGRKVELFWQQVGSFTCTESVTQEKLGKKDKIEFRKESIFDYLALTKPVEDSLVTEELRLPQKKRLPKVKELPLLSTNGFPTILLIFHPKYQSNYRYQIEAGDSEKDKLIRVQFEHISGTPSTCALAIRDRIYPLDLKGTAWIDAATGVIQKINAGLTTPMTDINIQAFDIDAEYQLQSFSADPDAEWLPSTVAVDVRTALQHWRNTHLFSQYKRFTVQSSDTRSR